MKRERTRGNLENFSVMLEKNLQNNNDNTTLEKELTGEAFLNSRREYWRKEIAKDPNSYRNNNCQPNKKEDDDSDNFPNLFGYITGGIVLAFFLYCIASGGGPLLIFLMLYVGAMLLKCMR